MHKYLHEMKLSITSYIVLFQTILICDVIKGPINLGYKATLFNLKIFIHVEYLSKITCFASELNFNSILSTVYQVLKALNQEITAIKLMCISDTKMLLKFPESVYLHVMNVFK